MFGGRMKRFASESGWARKWQSGRLMGEALLGFWPGLPSKLFCLCSSMKMEGQGCFKHGWSDFCFYPFWEEPELYTCLRFDDLRAFHTKVDFHLGLDMFHNMLKVKVDHIGMDWDLGESICKFWLTWFDLWIMTISNFWTKAKWKWFINFAWNLCQMFFVISLIKCKNNQVKMSYGLKMTMW